MSQQSEWQASKATKHLKCPCGRKIKANTWYWHTDDGDIMCDPCGVAYEQELISKQDDQR